MVLIPNIPDNYGNMANYEQAVTRIGNYFYNVVEIGEFLYKVIFFQGFRYSLYIILASD